MNSLYLTSTYYHVLISCVKQMADKDTNRDIAITAYIPDGKLLVERLIESKLFRKAFYIGEINEYVATGRLDYLLNQHKKNIAKIEKQLDFSFIDYDNISLFHDDIWAAHYMKDKRLPYNLIEDALDIYKFIERTKFSYLVPHNGLKLFLKKITRIGYLPLFCDKCMLSAEVNSADSIAFRGFAGSRLKEIPRKDLFDALSIENKAMLRRIFLPDELPQCCSKSVLIITQPLYEDGIVDSYETQLRIYKELIAQYVPVGNEAVIKPHPRDNMIYKDICKKVTVLNKNTPAEIFALCTELKFSKAVTLFSTAIHSINADEKIIIQKDLLEEK